MKSLCFLLLLPVVTSLTLPEFDDPFFGKLIVSRKKFPFLTSKQQPDLGHVFPTDPQMTEIKAAVQQHQLRAKRDTGDKEIDLPDPAAGFDWFDTFQRFLGKFLKFEFSYELVNSTIIDPGSLPFDKIDQDAYFKAMVIDKSNFKAYLEDEFNNRMRELAKNEKHWLPAEKLIQEMKECLYFKYGSASDEDFKFDKQTGGVMVYYKVTCLQIADTYYVGISTYDNVFTLTDIQHHDVYTSRWSFLGLSHTKTEIRDWFEKRYITLNDLKTLLDYIMRDFAERIRLEYRQYLESANNPPPMIR
uniref:Uncharacterized protein n=1 Tax=Plectus sambesii TaxID=2011161 RepID=A0A914WT94_9BILA